MLDIELIISMVFRGYYTEAVAMVVKYYQKNSLPDDLAGASLFVRSVVKDYCGVEPLVISSSTTWPAGRPASYEYLCKIRLVPS